jgi:hypothetical protein
MLRCPCIAQAAGRDATRAGGRGVARSGGRDAARSGGRDAARASRRGIAQSGGHRACGTEQSAAWSAALTSTATAHGGARTRTSADHTETTEATLPSGMRSLNRSMWSAEYLHARVRVRVGARVGALVHSGARARMRRASRCVFVRTCARARAGAGAEGLHRIMSSIPIGTESPKRCRAYSAATTGTALPKSRPSTCAGGPSGRAAARQRTLGARRRMRRRLRTATVSAAAACMRALRQRDPCATRARRMRAARQARGPSAGAPRRGPPRTPSRRRRPTPACVVWEGVCVKCVRARDRASERGCGQV